MEYPEATDLLTSCVTLEDVATRLGASVQSVKQARLDPGATGHRAPPPGWREAVASLAQERGTELLELAASIGASQ